MLINYLPRDENVSLQEVENVGRTWVALVMMCSLWMHGDGFSATKMTFSSLSLAKTGIPSLDPLLLYPCSPCCCKSVSHSLHIVPIC